MLPLYNFSLSVYHLLVRFYSLFNPKAKKWIDGRRDWRAKLNAQINLGDSYYWIHCASLGEFEQGRPIIEGIRKRKPEAKILLSFFSPSGYEIRKDYALADIVCYLPMDSRRNARDFIDLVNPKWAIFIKYDLWHHYISELRRREIPSYLISAYFQKKQVYFRPIIGGFFRKLLTSLDEIFVQDEFSKSLLSEYKIYNASVSGDTRFDRVYRNAQNKKSFEKLSFIRPPSTLIAGSTWPKDVEILKKFWQSDKNKLNHMIIAPHEIESEIDIVDSTLYSSLNTKGEDSESILIIDNIGMLSSLYAYGSYAYIGGGFGSGIHNILEAAVYGVPIFFGPNYSRFKEAEDLIRLGGAFSISSADELIAKINYLGTDESYYNEVCTINKNYVLENKGASEKVLGQILAKQTSVE